jgi:hypothetical protein
MSPNLSGIELCNMWDFFMIPLLWLAIEFSYKSSEWGSHFDNFSTPSDACGTLVTHAM